MELKKYEEMFAIFEKRRRPEDALYIKTLESKLSEAQ
jgi:hypothetical protein